MKKSKNITFTIPEPCHEKWGRMTNAEQGRYCAGCAKTVIDFSSFTDRELIRFLKNIKGSFCGRFDEYQLNRPITVYSENRPSFLFKALVGGALATGLSMQTNAQVMNHSADKILLPIPVPPSKEQKAEQPDSSKAVYIKGTVINAKTKEKLKYLMITVDGTSYGVETDSMGRFTFPVPKELQNKPITLLIQESPFERSSTTIKAGKYPSNLKIGLKMVAYKRGGRKFMGRTMVCPSF